MVAAYWEQPLLQADVATWLGVTGVGAPASRIKRLEARGFEVVDRTGSLAELGSWLAQGTPCILFVRTGELPYWDVDTAHAVVLTGLTDERAFLLDPAVGEAPVEVSPDDLLLAWSYFDYTYAVLTVEST
jgi:ABC-type bacteriocin/lantibiotic exporter with double-glycine peptidase domain